MSKKNTKLLDGHGGTVSPLLNCFFCGNDALYTALEAAEIGVAFTRKFLKNSVIFFFLIL